MTTPEVTKRAVNCMPNNVYFNTMLMACSVNLVLRFRSDSVS